MVEVSDIIEAFNNAPNKNVKNPSPMTLYLIMNVRSISANIPVKEGQRVTVAQRRIAVKEAWGSVSYDEKAKFIEAAIQLGWVSRMSSVNPSTDLLSRLRAMRIARKNRKN